MAEAQADSKPGKRRAEKSKGTGASLGSTNRIRSLLASIIWLVAVLCALALAVGALVVALDFNRDNPVVDLILNVANTIDLGVFKDFEPDVKKGASDAAKESARQSAQTKSVMVNWGLAALIYLVVGKVLDRLIRPRS
jgi:uncharacterized membrane protein